MSSRHKDVDWLDGVTRPLDLETCEERPSSRDSPLCSRLYWTPDRRWVLDAGGLYLEVPPLRAANLLLQWGWPLPADLAIGWKIREDAERTPGPHLPLPVARAKDDLVILFGPEDEPLVLMKPKPPLGPIRHKIIETLIDAGDSGLTLIGLINDTGHGGARNALKNLADRDEDWRSVLQFPGLGRTRRYRIGRPGYRHSKAEAS